MNLFVKAVDVNNIRLVISTEQNAPHRYGKCFFLLVASREVNFHVAMVY